MAPSLGEAQKATICGASYGRLLLGPPNKDQNGNYNGSPGEQAFQRAFFVVEQCQKIIFLSNTTMTTHKEDRILPYVGNYNNSPI